LRQLLSPRLSSLFVKQVIPIDCLSRGQGTMYIPNIRGVARRATKIEI